MNQLSNFSVKIPIPVYRNRLSMARRRNRLLCYFTALTCLLVSVSASLTATVLHGQPNASHTSTISERTVIIVRTSHHCQQRLSYLLQSWIPVHPQEQSNMYLLTDNVLHYDNKTILNSFKNVIQTNCSQTHDRFDLCCKTAHEFELFYNLSKSNIHFQWMCRFDDDQYVNVKNLYRFLAQFDSSKPYYIGRTSIDDPIKVPEHNRTFRFATYGAGVCFSRTLIEKLYPYVHKARMPHGCMKHHISDDAYIGYLNEFILNVSLLSLRERFHSHLEKLDKSFRSFDMDYLQQAITLGFAWDRYTLNWLPVIHQLIQLADKSEKLAVRTLWTFLQTYEKQHPIDITDEYDRSCTSYVQRHQKSKRQSKV